MLCGVVVWRDELLMSKCGVLCGVVLVWHGVLGCTDDVA